MENRTGRRGSQVYVRDEDFSMTADRLDLREMTVFVTDGHLPYLYGRETTGYEVANFLDALTKARTVRVADQRRDGTISLTPAGFILGKLS